MNQLHDDIRERTESKHCGHILTAGFFCSVILYSMFGAKGAIGGGLITAAFALSWQKRYEQELALLSQDPMQLATPHERLTVDLASTNGNHSNGNGHRAVEPADGYQWVAQAATTVTMEPETTPQTTESDLATSLASKIQSTLIVGQPGAGKGVVVAQALRRLKEMHPELKIWVVDPKADESERWYWEPADHYLPAPVRPFTTEDEMERITAKIDEFIYKFQFSTGPKLLVIDEALALKEKSEKWFKGLMSGFNALCSMGRSRKQYGWLVSQSPNTADFGVSGGVRNVYRRILLIHRSNLGLISNRSTFFTGEPPAELFKGTGRVYFDSTSNEWGEVPVYDVEPSNPTAPQLQQPATQPSRDTEYLLSEIDDPNLKALVQWLSDKGGSRKTFRDFATAWACKQKVPGLASREVLGPLLEQCCELGRLRKAADDVYEVM